MSDSGIPVPVTDGSTGTAVQALRDKVSKVVGAALDSYDPANRLVGLDRHLTDAILASPLVREAQAEWERSVLTRFVATIPPQGEAPDYIQAVTDAMISARVGGES